MDRPPERCPLGEPRFPACRERGGPGGGGIACPEPERGGAPGGGGMGLPPTERGGAGIRADAGAGADPISLFVGVSSRAVGVSSRVVGVSSALGVARAGVSSTVLRAGS